jgi:hypothetical protein
MYIYDQPIQHRSGGYASFFILQLETAWTSQRNSGEEVSKQEEIECISSLEILCAFNSDRFHLQVPHQS